MNNFFKRFSIIFLLTLLFSVPVFSEEWYLCMGSFKNEKNAQSLVESLKYNGFDSIIDNYEKNSELYYRVLLAQSYSDRNTARSKIKEFENNPVIKKLKINGIWICTASENLTKKLEPKTPVDVTKDLVIEKEGESPTEKAQAEKTQPEKAPAVETPSVDAKNVSTVSTAKTTETTKTTESTKAKTTDKAKSTEKKKSKESTKKTAKDTSKDTAKDTSKESTKASDKTKTEDKKNDELVQEELPPIEEEVFDSDLIAQAKKIEKEIAEKNAASSASAVDAKSVNTLVTAKETEESLPKDAEAQEETAPAEEAEAETESETVSESGEEEKTETEATEAAESEKEKEEEPEELPSITLEINNAATDSLKVNYAEDVAFSEQKPYTVFVRSYRDAKRAEFDKKRLDLFDSQASVIKTYSEARGF